MLFIPSRKTLLLGTAPLLSRRGPCEYEANYHGQILEIWRCQSITQIREGCWVHCVIYSPQYDCNRGWTATNINAQKKLFTVCAIGPIRLLALASYRSLTNPILIFGILGLNFQSEFQQYAGSSLASSVLLCGLQYFGYYTETYPCNISTTATAQGK